MNWEKYSLHQIKTESDGAGTRLISLFARDYAKLMNADPCLSCPGLQQRFNKFITKRNTMKDIQNSGFKLKPMYEGISLGFGSQKTLSSANLSDEVAVEFIKKHPKGVGLFSKLPEGFDAEKAEVKKDKDQDPERIQELMRLKKEELEKEATTLEVSTEGTKKEIAQRIYDAEIAIQSEDK